MQRRWCTGSERSLGFVAHGKEGEREKQLIEGGKSRSHYPRRDRLHEFTLRVFAAIGCGASASPPRSRGRGGYGENLCHGLYGNRMEWQLLRIANEIKGGWLTSVVVDISLSNLKNRDGFLSFE